MTLSKRILMIVTSNATMGTTGKATGIWAEELAAPYYQFIDAGVSVDIASPTGGQVPLDAGSVKAKGENSPAVERMLADVTLNRTLSATHVVASIDAANYDAVFFPGGHGTMRDLPNDAGVKRAVESAFAANKIIGSVCHGAAGLVSAKRADGKSILAGKRVNSFTDAEETATGLMNVVPFALESRIRELGASFVSAPNWQTFAVRDGDLITGQNPASSELVATHILTALNIVSTRKAA
jgi:putative intracellular protease/amidase